MRSWTRDVYKRQVINKFSKDIAVYNLFSRIGIDEGTDQKTYLNRYNAAIKMCIRDRVLRV